MCAIAKLSLRGAQMPIEDDVTQYASTWISLIVGGLPESDVGRLIARG